MELVAEKSATILWDYLDVKRLICGKIFVDFFTIYDIILLSPRDTEGVKTMTIYFDMDGTIADLYNVANWLPKLNAADPSPYIEASPLCDMEELTRLCKMLQHLGYEIGIISWCSKDATKEYNSAVRKAKRAWLKEHFPIKFNEIHIIKHGAPKPKFYNEGDILIDDEYDNRFAWELKGGQAVDPTAEEIATFLRRLLPDEI